MHLLLMPQSMSKEQVFPTDLSRSNGSYTGTRSFELPGNNPPAQMPYNEPERLIHRLPGSQSTSNSHANERVLKRTSAIALAHRSLIMWPSPPNQCRNIANIWGGGGTLKTEDPKPIRAPAYRTLVKRPLFRSRR